MMPAERISDRCHCCDERYRISPDAVNTAVDIPWYCDILLAMTIGKSVQPVLFRKNQQYR